jgi:hypothetical protein
MEVENNKYEKNVARQGCCHYMKTLSGSVNMRENLRALRRKEIPLN